MTTSSFFHFLRVHRSCAGWLTAVCCTQRNPESAGRALALELRSDRQEERARKIARR